jgi:hypothetical protein
MRNLHLFVEDIRGVRHIMRAFRHCDHDDKMGDLICLEYAHIRLVAIQMSLSIYKRQLMDRLPGLRIAQWTALALTIVQ